MHFGADTRKQYIRKLAQQLDRRELEARIIAMAAAMGHERFREQAARDIVAAAGPGDVLPEIYSGYRAMVVDGIRFMISRLPVPRIAELIADQARAASDASAGERLLMLARRLATLHKLGQMIARNRHLDPGFRKWLIALENGPCTVPMAGIAERIAASLGEDLVRFDVTVDPAPIAEASVGVAVAFTFRDARGRRRKGVFKVLKPGIRRRLGEELEVLSELAGHLDRRRHRYDVGDFRFSETFADMRTALLEEVDLSGEQRKLRAARRFYRGFGPARVPEVFAFSTPEVTAMDFFPGAKITDAAATPQERGRLARSLFNALIWRPLFSMDPDPPVHGDPHAGNLLADFPDGASGGRIGLIDWSLSTTLPRPMRGRLVFTMMGILMADLEMIADGIASLSSDAGAHDAGFRRRIQGAAREIMAGREFQSGGIARKAFVLVDNLALAGFRFPTALLLFRKTFFTLEGVLADLRADFDLDRAMIEEMAALLMSEAPQRWAALLFPFSDRPEYYRSQISNLDLRILAQHFLTAFLRRSGDTMATLATAGMGMLCPIPFHCLPLCFIPRS